MFSIPNLPTDSLYKFLLVSGLILMIYSGYLRKEIVESDQTELFKVDSLNIVLNENYRMRMRILDARTIEIRKYIDSTKVNRRKNNEARASVKAAIIELDSIRKEFSNENIKKNLMQSKQRIRDNTRSNTIILIWGYLISGAYMFLVGANNWLKKIQRPQDEITYIQLEISRLQLDKEKANSPGVVVPEANQVIGKKWKKKLDQIYQSIFDL